MGVFFQPRQPQADPSDPLQTQADLADAKLVDSLTCWLVDFGVPRLGNPKICIQILNNVNE